MDILKEVEDKLSILKGIYDIIRIIDPINKKLIDVSDDKLLAQNESCFGFWSRGPFCENCISMRAYLENDTFVKVENSSGKVFLVTAMPIKINDNTYVLEILKDISKSEDFSKKSKGTKDDLEVLTRKINEKVITDSLTGIYNKSYINERLPFDMNKASIKGEPISIIMADIDLFKNINDSYGDIIGDKVIEDFAKLIKKTLREDTHWVGRYEGEKFLIVLGGTDSEGAYNIAESIRLKLENTNFKYENADIRITSSFGVHSINNFKLDLHGFISGANENLYKAKQLGRNKTVIDKQKKI
ncbi:GGDEF domain-containing protein [Clostridium sp.]|uniref:GGDEF domain-containing protein n=1 Tax=Clostridium sp. TaxID=1506 RepID=UPI002FCA1B2A